MFQEILTFWFEEIKPKQWWIKDDEFDQLISRRFSKLHTQATRCELFDWRESAEGRLAEIIILDQFSRNMFRGSPLAFANDKLALALAQEAIAAGADHQLDKTKRSFFYLPFMHSESKTIHEVALALFKDHENESNLNSEIRHKAIIDRFNRYPHRNDVLGRESTIEEKAFLSEPGSTF